MTISYPVGLPTVPLANGWRVDEAARPNLTSTMNTGVVRQRRRFTAVVGKVTLVIFMELADFATWKSFHRDTLGNGAARFTMPVWDGTGQPTRTVQLREGGGYGYVRMGRGMAVTLPLDVWGL